MDFGEWMLRKMDINSLKNSVNSHETRLDNVEAHTSVTRDAVNDQAWVRLKSLNVKVSMTRKESTSYNLSPSMSKDVLDQKVDALVKLVTDHTTVKLFRPGCKVIIPKKQGAKPFYIL